MKKYHNKSQWLLPFACLALAGIGTQAAADTYVTKQDTYLKVSTAQSSSLPASQKCLVAKNTLVSVSSATVSGTHLQVSLENEVANCSLTSGYVYEPHMAPEANTLVVHYDTTFKTQAVQSSQLPASSKCDLPVGVYTSSQSIGSASAAHFYVKLENAPAACGFSNGYVYEGHSVRGPQAFSVTTATDLKISTAQTSELTAAEKCALPVGTYVSSIPVQDADAVHYKVSIPDIDNCAFNEGYVYFEHTNMGQPVDPGTAETWEFPMPDGVLGSGWCVCRNVGTSPHIGQDIYKYNGMSASATQDGVVTDIVFSSSCGYILYLEDEYNTLWRYVHLNSPSVAEGQSVSKGQTLASISAYPNSSCGTGPHLHFERRSAGYFGDQATGNSCQNGYRSCYYDPIKPWRAGYVPPAGAASASAPAGSARPDGCRMDVGDYAEVSRSELNEYKAVSANKVDADIKRVQNVEGQWVLEAAFALADNPKNQCANGNCIVNWAVVTEDASGNGLRRVFFDNKVRNYPLARDAREEFCVAEQSQRYWVLYTDQEGNQLRVGGNFNESANAKQEQ
ncbi:M23 family metallopeptidase [Simiduia sp. 21SJ11W-1]|uniref:M23 family metallopeptidase n=1 Tax=Simiduia sp. 21SJ11W-1 TaxID=2909669 RepID=UPI0020A0B236|nr:M23 family metallopeptidase [Simiduia sp. 21SJ11W-1]UTA48393.1 M23 family metallopeptidase [Simiduia sp. 21SJ11W-1]